MEHDFAAQLFSAHASKVTRNVRNRVIRSGNQDDARREKVSGQAAMRLPCSYEANRAPRGGLAAGNDNIYLPPQFPQAATQRTPDASRTNDGQGLFHLMLG